MLVRRAEIKDIEKINELLLQVAMVHHYGRPDLFKANCRKYKNDELVEIVKDDNRPIFVAEDDGVVMGYAFCVITDRKDDNVLTDMKNLYIDDLCVDENMRDKHVGTVIYDYVKKYAKEIGCYNLTLNVWSCNESAQKFYEKQGYDIAIGYRNLKNGNDSIISACSGITFAFLNSNGNETKSKQSRNITLSGTGLYIDGKLIK